MKNRTAPFFFAICILGLFYHSALAQKDNHKLIIFHSPSCHKCIEAKEKLIPQIEKESAGRFEIEYRDISDIENYKFMLALKERHNLQGAPELPVFYFAGRFLNNKNDISAQVRQLAAEKGTPFLERVSPPSVDLLARFKDFRAPAVIGAGLIDGINPCAFTVIVFFVSFLSLQGYLKKEVLIIGSSFIFAVFTTYILIGLGLFGAFYRLSGFAAVAKLINLSIGAFSIALGFLALYDFFKFKKTGLTEGLVLQLPKIIKDRIHGIIGEHYRVTQPAKKKVAALAVSALVTGFLISILEAVCTGQVYLPTIAFVLKTTPFKLQAAFFLVLYNLMFILPLLLIFMLALWGVTSGQFAHFLKRHLLAVKILMAALFFVLGFYLIAHAQGIEGENEWDFGRVKEGMVLKHNFTLKNETQNVLEIKEITTSCGCTVSKVKKKKLRPQESTIIEVKLHTRDYSGPVQQFVYVHTNDLDNPILRFIIKAQVDKNG